MQLFQYFEQCCILKLKFQTFILFMKFKLNFLTKCLFGCTVGAFKLTSTAIKHNLIKKFMFGFKNGKLLLDANHTFT